MLAAESFMQSANSWLLKTYSYFANIATGLNYIDNNND